ncbi:MAG: aminoacyl-tRNA hydrolase [Sphingomonadales bacterium]|nr:aminoacyl-tRNA hydrolase [Sphingomonadales bacterium]
MKFLVVGLGNPGEEYQHTRHNIGFDVLDEFATRHNAAWAQERHGWVAKASARGRTIILLKPNTYMNLSGKAVSYWLQAEKLPLSQLLVLLDDLALPSGKLRLRLNGSDGGHNGLKSINETLGTNNYARLRFGIGSDFPKGRQSEFVLGKWYPEEQETIKAATTKAADAVLLYTTQPQNIAMSRINAAG